MRISRALRAIPVAAAMIGLCIPQAALASEPAPQAVVTDVALNDGGTLNGRVIDPQGGGTIGVPVSLRTQDQEHVAATTTTDGHFSVKGLRGGVYQLAAGQGHGTYRLWSPGTAPPSAQKDAIVYTQNGPQRSNLKMLLTNPIVIAGIVATAIAVPVALANSRHSSP